MATDGRIERPDDPALGPLCEQLESLAPSLDHPGAWPAEQLEACGRHGIFEWFIDRSQGGQGWSDADVARGYLRLSAACLTTTFVITQRTGACRRIAQAEHDWARTECLPDLVAGRRFATVGISHLTTSRRHLKRPVLVAEQRRGCLVLNGYSPWVTGAAHADWIVTGAAMEGGAQVLVAVPRDLPGMTIEHPVDLVSLAASQTGPVRFTEAEVSDRWILAGPAADIMKGGVGARSGGLQTSTLAAGLADSAIRYIEQEATGRNELSTAGRPLREQWNRLVDDLLNVAAGEAVCSNQVLRSRANSLVLRATQSALAVAKGAGYVVGHPVGRWCREALFFLVWSCPQPVMAANLCELAGVSDPQDESEVGSQLI